MVKTKQTHVNNEDYKNGGLQLLLVHGVEDAASLSSPLCCTRSQSATCSLMKEHSAQTLSWECHAKLLTTCWTILTFTLSPLRRMFSRLTNSSASFRDSSCNKKKQKNIQQWTCYCTLSAVESATSRRPHGVKRVVVQDRWILQTRSLQCTLKSADCYCGKTKLKKKVSLVQKRLLKRRRKEKRYNVRFLL